MYVSALFVCLFVGKLYIFVVVCPVYPANTVAVAPLAGATATADA